MFVSILKQRYWIFVSLVPEVEGGGEQVVTSWAWPGQVAPVSRFPTVVTVHPTEPCHPLPPRNQTPWPGGAVMQVLIGGLRAMATGGSLLPAGQLGPPASRS